MDRLLVVDGDNLAHRLAHVNADVPPGERFGSLLGKLKRAVEPTHAIVVFDPPPGGPNWRRELWPGYKANRERDPAIDGVLADCRAQCRFWRVAQARVDGVEADDLIGSYVVAGLAEGMEVVIHSGDKDLLQLVRGPFDPDAPWVRQLDDVRKMTWRAAEVYRRFGVLPSQIPDYLALVGDRVDGIPGVPKIGPKTAAKLLSEFGDLAAVLDRAPLIKSTRIMRAVIDGAEDARLSLRLAKLRTNIELPVPLAETMWSTP